MGMPCQVNSILKLSAADGYPVVLEVGTQHEVCKAGYRILPMDVPLPLVNEQWIAWADVVIRQLLWENGQTQLRFEVQRLYAAPFAMKE